MRTWKPLSAGVVGAAMAVVLAACGGGSSSSSTTTTQNPAQATALITQNWTLFFDGGNPNSNAKLAILQNNGKLGSTFQKNLAGQPAAAMTAAKVTNVTVLPASQCQQAAVPSPCAKVSYDLINRQNGSPLLAGQTGYAVYVNGQWRISENTFCALIALGGGQCPA
jgi:hypothetical protein